MTEIRIPVLMNNGRTLATFEGGRLFNTNPDTSRFEISTKTLEGRARTIAGLYLGCGALKVAGRLNAIEGIEGFALYTPHDADITTQRLLVHDYSVEEYLEQAHKRDPIDVQFVHASLKKLRGED